LGSGPEIRRWSLNIRIAAHDFGSIAMQGPIISTLWSKVMFSKVRVDTTTQAGFGAMFTGLIGLVLFGTALAAAENQGTEMNPEQAIQRLKDGNERFAEGKSSHPDITAERRQDTAVNGQHPFATVISCSDSRVPAEILFDQGIGDIFVIRVAGNVCNVDEIGSAEYGAEHLGTPALVVLGHTRCGAVTAVAQGAELHGNIHALVHNIFQAVETAKDAEPDLQGDALVAAAVEANVRQSIADLLENSPAARERVEAGKLKIAGAVYDLGEGRVKWLDDRPQPKQSSKKPRENPEHAEGK
jgi:carbonic anhydrase